MELDAVAGDVRSQCSLRKIGAPSKQKRVCRMAKRFPLLDPGEDRGDSVVNPGREAKNGRQREDQRPEKDATNYH